MKKKVVLLVEDDVAIRSSLHEFLDFEDYEVYEASNGKDALDKMASLPREKWPGLIILDLMMPVMDGKTFLRVIRNEKSKEFNSIPVIVATANGSTSKDDLPMISEFIRKPFNIDDLLSKLDHYFA